MIRINLAPTTKRKVKSVGPTTEASSGGALWFLGMLVLWIGMGGIGWWLLGLEEEVTQDLRAQTAAKNTEIEKIKKEIDEAGLKARQAQVEQVEVAINKLQAKRRTPAYVMYELAMILTDAKDGGGPDIDQEKYRQNLKADPQSAINDKWDPTGLWINSIKEAGGTLTLTGAARDATDLTEFTRRLRASARFGNLSNPDFQRSAKAGTTGSARNLTWKLNVQVRRWD
jgi:Tfp pilus assembly protein PilN